MKRLLVLLLSFCFACSLFADAKAVRQTVLDVQKNILAGNLQNAVKYYHKNFISIDSKGKKTNIRHLRSAVNTHKRFQQAIKPDSKLLDIVNFYSYVRRKKLSDEDKKTVLAIQDSEIGKTRADALRKELQQLWDVQFKKMSDSWNTLKIVSVSVNGNSAQVVFTMTSSSKVPDEITWDLVKVKKSWRIIKSTTKKPGSIK